MKKFLLALCLSLSLFGGIGLGYAETYDCEGDCGCCTTVYQNRISVLDWQKYQLLLTADETADANVSQVNATYLDCLDEAESFDDLALCESNKLSSLFDITEALADRIQEINNWYDDAAEQAHNEYIQCLLDCELDPGPIDPGQ